MKIHPECVPCLLKRALFEAELSEEDKKKEVVKRSLSILKEYFGEEAVSAEVATKVHGEVYDILGTDDPYYQLKKKSNRAAERLLPPAKEEIEKGGGLKKAILVSIAGNVLDFGYRDDIDTPDYLIREFQNILDEGLDHDDTEEIEAILEKGENVVFFTDNAGEIVFDTLLLEKLKEYDVNLTVVVKKEPILTDATKEDALKYGVEEVADQLETTGGFAVGVDFDILPEKVKERLERADLIIAKGMANWESFSEKDYSPIAFLTRTKCKPVADSMGVHFDKNVAKLFQ